MKYYYLAFILFYQLQTGFSQNTFPPIQWLDDVQTNLGSQDESGIEVYDIAVTGDGALYAALRCYSDCTFSNGQTVSPSVNGESLVLVKYDLQGNIDWLKELGFVGILFSGARIMTTNSGGVFIAGSFSVPNINFGNGISVSRKCSSDCDEIFVARYTADGQAEWARTITGSESIYLSLIGLETDQSGKLYLAANYTGSVLNLGPNLIYNNLPGSSFFWANFDGSTGAPQIARFANADSGPAELIHLDVNNSGQAVLVGSFTDSLKFASGVRVVSTNAFQHYFVAGLNPSGGVTWARVLSSSEYAYVEGIDMDEQGRAYLAIDASGDLKLDNGTILTISSTYAGSVLRLNATGFAIPVFIEFDLEDYAVSDVALDAEGNIYTSGYISEVINVDGEAVNFDGCFDGLITATSSNGLHLWARTVGGTGCEAIVNAYNASTMAFDADGFLYTSGLFLDGFSEDGFNRPGDGAFLAKYNSNTVNTEEPYNFGTLPISPNPNKGTFTLNLLSEPVANAWLRIHDLSGREVFNQEITSLQTEINTTLSAGAYFVSLQNGANLFRQKMIVSH
jgi:hypothetical protein